MKTKRVSFTIPTYPALFDAISIDSFKNSLSTLFMDSYHNTSQGLSSNRRRVNFSGFGKKLPKINWKKVVRIGLPVIGIIVLGIVVWSAISPRESSQAIQGTQVQLPEALAKQDLNREFSFPVKDASGKEVTRFKVLLQSAEIRNQIIVKGQSATSVAGRTFLILNVKITNDFDQPLNINTRDYVRIVVDGNEQEILAPEIHNDPVEVQAISTKLTRLGIAIDENARDIELRIGEIDGDKETFKLDLSR